jgi:hypothetical protein
MKTFLQFLSEQKYLSLAAYHGGAWVHDDGGPPDQTGSIPIKGGIPNEPFKNLSYFRRPGIKKYIGSIVNSIRRGVQLPPVFVTVHPATVHLPENQQLHSVLDGNHRWHAANIAQRGGGPDNIDVEHIAHENIRLVHPDQKYSGEDPGEKVYENGVPLTKFIGEDGSYDMEKPRKELGGLTLGHYFAEPK